MNKKLSGLLFAVSPIFLGAASANVPFESNLNVSEHIEVLVDNAGQAPVGQGVFKSSSVDSTSVQAKQNKKIIVADIYL